ncbi:F-box/kelch-repeat protein At3g23880-like [Papaver somniferum]|uniref:F-box/kelch-repeat protein At3g23880-like n=1 Tax=Papaver somniferum TaxID=3469 RepID=UPI000E702116|nr:F-box/kelch-repeat protein At3g23880-like [Papaver somniferum]
MSFSKLPEDIQLKILMKVPAKSILTSKYVCKLWFTLVSNPEFVKNHLHRTIQRKSDHKLMLSYYDSTRPDDAKPAISSIDYASILQLSLPSEYECDGDIPVNYPIYPSRQEKVKFLRILGSCNGLICLGVTSDSDFTKIYVWNPSTKEYKEILGCDIPSSDKNWSYASYGFGFDKDNDDYKVVRIPCDSDFESSVIQVYTMGSDAWHEVQTIPYWLQLQGKTYSLPFFNGALHWLGFTTLGTSSDFIVSFELSNERLVQLPFPEKNTNEKVFTTVGVLNDCLCSTTEYTDDHVDIWVMQDYGMPDSWTKRFTFTITSHEDYHLCCKPIWSFENGEILLDTYSDLIIYDPRSGKVRKAMPVRDSYKSRDVEFYVESLVSVKSVGS